MIIVDCWSGAFAIGLSQGKYERKENIRMRMGVILGGQWKRELAGRKVKRKKIKEKRKKTKNIKGAGLC